LKKIIKNIFIILNQREKKNAIELIFLDILTSLLDIGFLVILLYVIQFYTGQTSASFFPKVLNQHHLLFIVVFFILFSIKNIFSFRVLQRRLKFVYAVASRLSEKNLMNYLNGTFSDYVTVDSSVHIRKISQQPIEFCHYVLTGFQQIISQSVLILLTIIALIIYNPLLFCLLFLILAPAIILAGILMKKKLNFVRKAAKSLSEKTLQHLKEAISGFIESNIFHSKSFFLNRYKGTQRQLNNVLSDQLVIQNMPSRLIEIFAVLGLLFLIIIHWFTTASNAISVITIGAFMAAAYKIIPGVVKILNSSGQIKTYEFTVDDLLKNNYAVPKNISQKKSPLDSVEFRNISFQFSGEPLLKHVSFVVSKNDFTGLSAISGKGKTTMMNLLLGFLEPDEGSILVNGISAEMTERQEFWKNISYVKQQPLLIYDSILKNITLNENVFDFQKLEEVLRVTGLKEIVSNFHEGYNKIITEDGKNLSGGQRQRIAIARALYKEADLIILDEPFSELDKYSEDCLLQYFSELANHGKIIILITHNKESLLFCNKIISLDEKASACISDFDSRLS
jgi:ABC-type bacteriocin/lantibiotic exporter with double-glycine peptidase domain